MSRWRAAVLIAVHVVILVHLLHWWITGTTLTPLEPAEAMKFSKYGIINVGVIFFALAILSTLIFGRYVCGWGCHVLALQDLSRWGLRKIGIRPRPMRSRLLIWVPLIAFIYMFVLPLVDRVAAGASVAPVRSQFLTADFWATFPGWIIGGLTLATCGFFIVYFLGAKGFCTYGCPYGGVFALIDRAAPGRIRVTDACEGCGHCTAVCSSNVRVHREVREFGTVVDPGCMKCMDCVSVCPNHALYFGFGAPAVLVRRTMGAGPGHARAGFEWIVLSCVFMGTSYILFHASYASLPPWAWAACSLGAAFLTSRARGDYSFGEEIALAAFFLLAFGAFRGLYGIPFLFALGIAAILAFLSLQTVRLITRANVRLQGVTLRRGGRITRRGRAFVTVMVAVAVAWSYGGALQVLAAVARRSFVSSRSYVPDMAGFVSGADRLGDTQKRAVDRGLDASMLLDRWSPGDDPTNDLRLAWFHVLRRDYATAERLYRRIIEVDPKSAATYEELARLLEALGRHDDALEVRRGALAANPERVRGYLALGLQLTARGSFDQAARIYEQALAVIPGSAEVYHNYAILDAARGRPEASLERLYRAIELNPRAGRSRHLAGELLCAMGRFDEGIAHLRVAALLLPDDPPVHYLLGMALARTGPSPEAQFHLRRAQELNPDRADYARALARYYAVSGDATRARAFEERAAALQSQTGASPDGAP